MLKNDCFLGKPKGGLFFQKKRKKIGLFVMTHDLSFRGAWGFLLHILLVEWPDKISIFLWMLDVFCAYHLKGFQRAEGREGFSM